MSTINIQALEAKLAAIGYAPKTNEQFKLLLSQIHEELTGAPIQWTPPFILTIGAIYECGNVPFIYTGTGKAGEGIMVNLSTGTPWINVPTYDGDYYKRNGFAQRAKNITEYYAAKK